MSSIAFEPSSKPVRASRPKGGAKKTSVVKSGSRKFDAPRDQARVTKQEQVLTLLNRPDGASIDEIMQAMDWQQHSVRGFLAGTVKKKLGFTLTSSKELGEARRYRIVTRRGR